MIIEIVGDLLCTKECNIIVHQANLFHTFGAGIARSIREKFPEAYAADCKTNNGDPNKLGTFSTAQITDQRNTTIEYIVNLYSQTGLGSKDRQTSYDYMVVGLEALKERLDKRHAAGKKVCLGIPFQIGCGLANGSWTVVHAVIESIFKDAPYDVCIYTLPELVK